MSSAEYLLEAKGVEKSYPAPSGSARSNGISGVQVLRGVDFVLNWDSDVCILGPSGAGKSTLLHVLGGLDKPTKGGVFFRGKNLSTMGDGELSGFRNQHLGFVFQFHYLLNEFNAVENVALPLRIRGLSRAKAVARAMELLREFGLQGRAYHFANELSGGERQRVAVARAMVGEPQVVLADEPTGNLDTENKKIVEECFFNMKKKRHISLVVVTHDTSFASRFTHQQTLIDGKLAL